MTSRAPLITAIVLLLLPLLYVGSYLALVTPQGRPEFREATEADYQAFSYPPSQNLVFIDWLHYRCGERWCSRIFYPVEKIDRKLRPAEWRDSFGGPQSSPPMPEPIRNSG